MKAPSSLSILTLFLFLISFSSFSQNPDNWLDSSDPPWYPKVYLHTDREVYFQGDSIWFKAYYLDGETQLPFQGLFTLYTDLVDDQGQPIASQILLLDDGQSAGKIEIPDNLVPGSYLLRAFTDFQRSIGEDAFFHKQLKVTSVQSRMEEAIPDVAHRPPDIDVAFLPEGGFLLEEQENSVGVIATDQNGVGMSVQGEILNGHGEVVVAFNTMYKGMGVLQFSPRKGESYHVKIKDYPDFEYSFDEIVEEGIKIAYSSESEVNLRYVVSSNSKAFQGKSYHFTILHRGRVLFHQEFVQKSNEFPLQINRDALPAGINRFVLLDEHYKPISERLHFSDMLEVNRIEINPDQMQYRQRSEVQVELFDEEEIRDFAISNLSVAVVDAYALDKLGPEQTILSWLLVDSELKGSIPSPAHFFEEEKQLSSREKLNLLMLTHGWSRYIWTALAENETIPEIELYEGITLEGTLKHPLTKKPLARGDVDLKIYNNGIFITNESKTDKNGRFAFENVIFTDTASVLIQGRNKKGKLYTLVDIDPLFTPNPALSDPYLPINIDLTAYTSQLYEQKYYSDLDLKNFVLESGSILLEEVTITEKRVTGDGHFRMYMKPYNSMKVTNKDYGYRNVADYLQGRVAGVTVVGNSIQIRGPGNFSGPSRPLYLLDGTPMRDPEVIMSIPMSEIDVVEVLINPAEAGVFGVNAGGGVVSVFTRRGGAPFGDTFSQGTLARRLTGYEAYREFYVPKYTPENRDSKRPDHRLTLYWNPMISTEQGKASLSFFTSDDITRYKILVEGITNTGEICLGTSEFEVSRQDSSAKK